MQAAPLQNAAAGGGIEPETDTVTGIAPGPARGLNPHAVVGDTEGHFGGWGVGGEPVGIN